MFNREFREGRDWGRLGGVSRVMRSGDLRLLVGKTEAKYKGTETCVTRVTTL